MTEAERPSLSAGWEAHLKPDELAAYEAGTRRERGMLRRKAKGRAIYHNSKPKKIAYDD